MKIYLTDQSKYFQRHLLDLKQKDVVKYAKAFLNEKESTIEIHTNRKLNELNLDFLWNYNIFPKNIMSYYTEWRLRRRQMQIGDTIVQQAFIPPIKMFSQKVIFGVRINKIIDEENRKGFSYETLQGHVEKGESTFTVEKVENKTIFKIHTFSKPRNVLTQLLGPIVTLPYQSFCTRRALKNVKRQIEQLT